MFPLFPLPQSKLFLLKPVFLLGILMISAGVQAQNCLNRITVESGEQHFSCTDVTVTSDGPVIYFTFCNIGPYWIGHAGWGFPSSFTFTFSKPVAGVTLDFHGFDYHDPPPPPQYEVVTLDINGAPFPFPNAGVPIDCPWMPLAVVNASGGLQGDPAFGGGGSKNINISTPISTITVTNTAYNGNVGGVTFSIYFCCVPCVTKAGLIPSAPLNLCPDGIATVPPAGPNVLPPGTILQYILFSDPGDTLGSIISISNTPSFSFNPAVMQEGVTYYIAAIAGEELNGNVDLSDRCLDVSNEAVPVTWWPKPAVFFSTDTPDVCKGNCVDITAAFSGEPPFTLVYTSPYTGLQTKTFGTSFGIIQLCIPLTAPASSLSIEAIKLTDKFCICE